MFNIKTLNEYDTATLGYFKNKAWNSARLNSKDCDKIINKIAKNSNNQYDFMEKLRDRMLDWY